MAKGSKGPKSLLEKVDNEHPGFADEVSGLSVQQLEKRIADYQKSLEDSEQHKAANDVLQTAKAQVKELNAPYAEVRKAISLKTRFLVQLVREKGGV